MTTQRDRVSFVVYNHGILLDTAACATSSAMGLSYSLAGADNATPLSSFSPISNEA